MATLRIGLKELHLKEGTDLLSISMIDPSMPLRFGCCKGKCGTCAINVEEGKENLSPPTKQEIETIERLNLGNCRLACQCAVSGDVLIEAHTI